MSTQNRHNIAHKGNAKEFRHNYLYSLRRILLYTPWVANRRDIRQASNQPCKLQKIVDTKIGSARRQNLERRQHGKTRPRDRHTPQATFIIVEVNSVLPPYAPTVQHHERTPAQWMEWMSHTDQLFRRG